MKKKTEQKKKRQKQKLVLFLPLVFFVVNEPFVLIRLSWSTFGRCGWVIRR